MRVVISATGKDINDLMDVRFGRCRYFQIHDTEAGEFRVLENEGQKSGGGAGIAAAQQIIDEGVDVVITGSLGPNAFDLINKAGIKAYKCNEMRIKEVIDKFKNGELEEINMAGPAHHGM
ncbi:NifB/NifX family molybdenum-iron cluster-binding protein [Thermobrachium celere]|uniref:Glycine-rich cell wall structural protein n=1 Tax=Thermobrachium celere DSM 8682 TaxID=941824 RepID=R7RNU1_9CLOT|nr:NifB/NifX family molybdenum-iron cluster-binding protein [Thermobrachium celere]CDF57867.1 Glycine-rich cell wall structural protein precursor [Thermobrachium celere DSM 8682]